MTALLAAIAAACHAYCEHVRWKILTHTDTFEDEIDRLAADGSPAAKLRLARLEGRLRRHRQPERPL